MMGRHGPKLGIGVLYEGLGIHGAMDSIKFFYLNLYMAMYQDIRQ